VAPNSVAIDGLVVRFPIAPVAVMAAVAAIVATIVIAALSVAGWTGVAVVPITKPVPRGLTLVSLHIQESGLNYTASTP